MSKHLHIDPFAGIAGDMFLGACIDLGAPLEAIDAALRPLPIELPYRITVAETHRHAIRGLDLKVHIGEGQRRAAADHHHDHAHSHDHGHHHHDHAAHSPYTAIMKMIDQLDTAERARDRARRIVTMLGEAEAAVHGMSLDEVHFHEVGAVDSIVDMLGSAVALELLGVDTVSSAALPIGHGFVRCAHGLMPLPAPATAEILKGVPHLGVNREGETVTPTGAAIVAALASDFGPMPPMNVRAVGYGAGDRDTPDMPNLVRLFLGERVSV
ncbi:MAG: DUF111 family protein [Planctomycetes bacterium]|nr:DUF111 family protein [Planctomycetota bacterium]